MEFWLIGGKKSPELSSLVIVTFIAHRIAEYNRTVENKKKAENLTFGIYPSGEPQDHEYNFRWELGLDIMYQFSRSLHKDPILRCQAFPHFPEPISLFVLCFLSHFNNILLSKNQASIVEELEKYTPYFEGWFDKIDIKVWADIKRRVGKKEVQKYKSGSPFKELLRFVRNTSAHITELKVSKRILKSDLDSFYRYIDARFPVFLMIAYRVAYTFCREEDWFQYFLRCDDICNGILKEKPEFLCTYGSERLMSLLMTAYRPRGDGIQSLCSQNGEIVLEL